ncbi:hypothetical protein IQ260_26530 [Leptolyngbya cf. ectocarpi LEGE 11479]|uniref:Uncharacterized protein n=1 Tax=Leptolyngbya cf. ectocarpi LEGE 11479 TaxID=1828722 RepID=A0A928ZZ68_LEPEC|nr:hypothetical protein [Leptolyngbya ectocarpi]MBE9070202.1 hypothetical protein [Leptolyngbya cf. ectocarpi LEGE 11479]
MTIEKDARTNVTETRHKAEQLEEKVHNRAVESLDEIASVKAEEREQMTQQRQDAQHLQENVLSRAQESVDSTDASA